MSAFTNPLNFSVVNDSNDFRYRFLKEKNKGSCSLALHAEQNAILYAVKNNTTIDGSTLYVTLSPCIACARVIYTMGIKRVYYKNSYAEYKNIPTDEGVEFLKKFGVEVIRYTK